MKIPQETAFVKHFLRMILKIVQIAVFSPLDSAFVRKKFRPRGVRAV